MIEITCHEPTHYIAESMTLNKIDRVFTSIPSHAWLTVAPMLQNAIQPEVAHAKGLSDHAVMIVTVSSRARPDPETMPIKRECFEHPRFKERLKATRSQVDLDALSTWERWATHKALLRDAALHARDWMLTMEEHSDFSIQGTISSIARAIWANNVKLAKVILERSAFARKHIFIHDDTVQIIDPNAFEAEVSEFRHKFLAASAAELEASAKHPRTNAKKRRKLLSEIAANHRLAKLWLKQQKRLVLHGLRIPATDGSITTVTDGSDVTRGLASAWKPIFDTKPIPIDEADNYLKDYCGGALTESLSGR